MPVNDSRPFCVAGSCPHSVTCKWSGQTLRATFVSRGEVWLPPAFHIMMRKWDGPDGPSY